MFWYRFVVWNQWKNGYYICDRAIEIYKIYYESWKR